MVVALEKKVAKWGQRVGTLQEELREANEKLLEETEALMEAQAVLASLELKAEAARGDDSPLADWLQGGATPDSTGTGNLSHMAASNQQQAKEGQYLSAEEVANMDANDRAGFLAQQQKMQQAADIRAATVNC